VVRASWSGYPELSKNIYISMMNYFDLYSLSFQYICVCDNQCKPCGHLHEKIKDINSRCHLNQWPQKK
jgi:hypothetical protein